MSIVSDIANPQPKPVPDGDARERRRARLEGMAVTAASSIAAVLIAFAISALLLVLTGKNPGTVVSVMVDVATTSRFQFEMIERAVPLIISAVSQVPGSPSRGAAQALMTPAKSRSSVMCRRVLRRVLPRLLRRLPMPKRQLKMLNDTITI